MADRHSKWEIGTTRARINKTIKKRGFTPNQKKAVGNAIKELKNDPLPNGKDQKKLVSRDGYRKDVGHRIRIVYDLNVDEREIEVIDIGFREGVYKEALDLDDSEML